MQSSTLQLTPSSAVVSRLLAAIFVMILVMTVLSPHLLAQPPSAGGNEIANFKGKLNGLQRGVLIVTRDDGKQAMVQLPQDPAAFVFAADAKPQFLQRGMMVRFDGMFAPNGNPTEPVTKVEIFQPVNIKALRGHSRDSFMPGVHAVDKHGPKQPVKIAKYKIVGSLIGINNTGAIRVQAGKVLVNAQLDATATFHVRFNNLNLAKEGDPVSVEGFYSPPDDTKVRGDKITITTDRVYGAVTEPVKPVRKKRRTEKTTADEKDKKEESAADAKSNENAADKAETVK